VADAGRSASTPLTADGEPHNQHFGPSTTAPHDVQTRRRAKFDRSCLNSSVTTHSLCTTHFAVCLTLSINT
jgi:hypothetical protein